MFSSRDFHRFEESHKITYVSCTWHGNALSSVRLFRRTRRGVRESKHRTHDCITLRVRIYIYEKTRGTRRFLSKAHTYRVIRSVYDDKYAVVHAPLFSFPPVAAAVTHDSVNINNRPGGKRSVVRAENCSRRAFFANGRTKCCSRPEKRAKRVVNYCAVVSSQKRIFVEP